MSSLSQRSSATGQGAIDTGAGRPRSSQSSSARCGANGARIVTNGSSTARGRRSSGVQKLTNSIIRGRVVVPAGADATALQAAAAADPRIAEQLAGRRIVKVVAVPGRMVNFVLGD